MQHGAIMVGAAPVIPRRCILGGLAALAVAGWRPSAAAQATLPGDTTFRVIRKGSDIGRHTIIFRPEVGGFRVEADVDLAVKVAFVTAFRYRQTGRDRWQDEMLVESQYSTNDDGAKSALEARAEQGRFVVEGSSGRLVLPLGTMTDMCFWNEDIVRAPQVVDSQTGEATKLATSRGTPERLRVRGADVEARRYAVDARNGRSGSVWYDAAGHWIRAEFTTRGEHLTYELI